MRRTTIGYLVTLVLVVTGCAQTPGEGFQICDDSMDLPDDSFALRGAQIDGDTLAVDVGYSGGCETHRWTLCWDGSFMESSPVQARLSLYHDGGGDGCEAYLERTETFDLSEMRQSYEEGYQTDSGEISIGLTDYEGELSYEW